MARMPTGFGDGTKRFPPCSSSRRRPAIPMPPRRNGGNYSNGSLRPEPAPRRSRRSGGGAGSQAARIRLQDWEFFAKASLAGMNLQLVPRALFWYRHTPGSMIQTIDPHRSMARNVAAYPSHIPKPLHSACLLAIGLDRRQGALQHEVSALREQISAARNELALLQRQVTQREQENRDLLAACRTALGAPATSTPQAALDRYWDSRSWRLGRILRIVRGISVRNRPPEVRPVIHSWIDAATTIAAIRATICWEILGSLRALRRATSGHRMRDGNRIRRPSTAKTP